MNICSSVPYQWWLYMQGLGGSDSDCDIPAREKASAESSIKYI